MEISPPLFKDYAAFLKEHFAVKVQKLSIDGGFGCPNCDGTKGRGGCTYCNNRSFTPAYCSPADSIGEQLRKGIAFFGAKYPDMKYLAYFQAHTNTYAPLDTLRRKYEEALSHPDVVGLVVATRPDCVSDALLDYMATLSRRTFVMMEYGVESSDPEVLRAINRGHTFEQSRDAICRTASRGIHTCAHIILGLPRSSRSQLMDETALISALPLDILKLHQLQIVRHTLMAGQYEAAPDDFAHIFHSPQDYANLVADYIERLRPDITLERFTSQSPDDMLIAPRWGMKNYLFVNLLKETLQRRQTYQGRLWQPDSGDKE